MIEIAESIRAFVEYVQARSDVLVDRLPGIEGDAPVAPGAGLCGSLVDPRAIGLLERAIEQAAAGAASEGDRGRSLEDFDALRVVDVAEILHVVTEAVDEEVGAGIDAANDQFVAVAFALMHGNAGRVPRHIGQVLIALVPDEFLADHGQRLRDVDDRRVGLGRNRRAVGVVADGAGLRVLRLRKRLRLGRRLGLPRHLLPAPGGGTGTGASRGRAAAPDLGRGDADRRQLRVRPCLGRCLGGGFRSTGSEHRDRACREQELPAGDARTGRVGRCVPAQRRRFFFRCHWRAPNPACIRMRAAGNEVAVSVARIRVNANGAAGIQNPSRSKQF